MCPSSLFPLYVNYIFTFHFVVFLCLFEDVMSYERIFRVAEYLGTPFPKIPTLSIDFTVEHFKMYIKLLILLSVANYHHSILHIFLKFFILHFSCRNKHLWMQLCKVILFFLIRKSVENIFLSLRTDKLLLSSPVCNV